MGQAPAGKDCNKEGRGVPFVKTGEFGEERPVIREWTTDPKRLARESDMLISVVGATCGKINLGTNCAIGRSVAALRPHPQRLSQFFLYFFMEGQVQRLRAGSQGAAQTVISKEMLANTLLPLPPLEEQRRIVAVLDEVFEGLDRARAHAKANLQDARELFESYLADRFINPDPLWETTHLSKFCEKITVGHVGPMAKRYATSGTPFLRSQNVRPFEIDLRKV